MQKLVLSLKILTMEILTDFWCQIGDMQVPLQFMTVMDSIKIT